MQSSRTRLLSVGFSSCSFSSRLKQMKIMKSTTMKWSLTGKFITCNNLKHLTCINSAHIRVFIRLWGSRKPHLTTCRTSQLPTTSRPLSYTNISSQPHKYQNTCPQNAYPQVSHTDLYANDGERIQLIVWIYGTSVAASTFICDDLVARK